MKKSSGTKNDTPATSPLSDLADWDAKIDGIEKHKVEEALRTIQRYRGIVADKKLMGAVQKLAQHKLTELQNATDIISKK